MIRRLDDATADVGGVLATGDVEHARQAYAIGAAAHAASLVRQRAGQAGLAHAGRAAVRVTSAAVVGLSLARWERVCGSSRSCHAVTS